jgi:hypothetical protein
MREMFARLVGGGVVENDDSVSRPPSLVALLKRAQPLAVEAVLVSVVLVEKFVESAFALRLALIYRRLLIEFPRSRRV